MIEIDRERFLQLKQEIGVLPARSQCVKEAVQRAIDHAESMEDLKCILREIVKHVRFDR